MSATLASDFEQLRPTPWLCVLRPKTPEALYDFLRHSHPFWDRKGSFLFRGHADASWKLAPSIWRHEKASKYLSSIRFSDEIEHLRDQFPTISGADNVCKAFSPKHVADALSQVLIELNLVAEFHRLCDEVGLPMPPKEILLGGVSYPMPNDLALYGRWYTSNLFHTWAPTELFALAQHHGIPTRLLDCTYSPKKALLFAAKEVVDQSSPSDFCVWAFPDFYMLNVALAHFTPLGVPQVQIEELRFPRHQNLFLKQQDGRFLGIANAEYWKMVHGSYPDLESLLTWTFGPDGIGRQDINAESSSFKFYKGHDGVEEYLTPGARVYLPLVYKIIAPASFAEAVYTFLSKDYLTEIHLMPTYDNVAKFVDRLLVRRTS